MILSNRRYNCCQEISIDRALNGIGLLYNLRYDLGSLVALVVLFSLI